MTSHRAAVSVSAGRGTESTRQFAAGKRALELRLQGLLGCFCRRLGFLFVRRAISKGLQQFFYTQACLANPTRGPLLSIS